MIQISGHCDHHRAVLVPRTQGIPLPPPHRAARVLLRRRGLLEGRQGHPQRPCAGLGEGGGPSGAQCSSCHLLLSYTSGTIQVLPKPEI